MYVNQLQARILNLGLQKEFIVVHSFITILTRLLNIFFEVMKQ